MLLMTMTTGRRYNTLRACEELPSKEAVYDLWGFMALSKSYEMCIGMAWHSIARSLKALAVHLGRIVEI
jgi:hypothetical protein